MSDASCQNHNTGTTTCVGHRAANSIPASGTRLNTGDLITVDYVTNLRSLIKEEIERRQEHPRYASLSTDSVSVDVNKGAGIGYGNLFDVYTALRDIEDEADRGSGAGVTIRPSHTHPTDIDAFGQTTDDSETNKSPIGGHTGTPTANVDSRTGNPHRYTNLAYGHRGVGYELKTSDLDFYRSAYEAMRTDCICNSDCNCNAVCACHNDCGCNYSDENLKLEIKHC